MATSEGIDRMPQQVANSGGCSVAWFQWTADLHGLRNFWGQMSLWRHNITKVYSCLPQFLQANSGLVTEISSRPLFFTSCPPHYSPATLSLDCSPSVLPTAPKQIHYRTLGTKLPNARISYHIFCSDINTNKEKCESRFSIVPLQTRQKVRRGYECWGGEGEPQVLWRI